MPYVVDAYIKDCGLDPEIYKEALRPKTPSDRFNLWVNKESFTEGAVVYWGLMAYVLAASESPRVEALRTLATLSGRPGRLEKLEEFVRETGVRISVSEYVVNVVSILRTGCSQGTEFVMTDSLIRDFAGLVQKDKKMRNHLVEAVIYGSLSSIYPEEFRLCILRSLGRLLGTLEDGKGCLGRQASFRTNFKLDWLGPASAAKRPRTAPPPPPPWGFDFGKDNTRSDRPVPLGLDKDNEQPPEAARVEVLEAKVDDLTRQLEAKRFALELADAQLRAAKSYEAELLARLLRAIESPQKSGVDPWTNKLTGLVGSPFGVLDIPIVRWDAGNSEQRKKILADAYRDQIKLCYYAYGHDDPRYDEKAAKAMSFRMQLVELAREFLRSKYGLPR